MSTFMGYKKKSIIDSTLLKILSFFKGITFFKFYRYSYMKNYDRFSDK